MRYFAKGTRPRSFLSSAAPSPHSEAAFQPLPLPLPATEAPSGGARKALVAPVSSAVSLALIVTGLLLFTHFGRPFDRFLIGFHIPAVICGFGIVMILISGALKQLLTPIGIALIALVAWMTIAIPLSTWRGGSAQYVLQYVAFWVTLLLIVAHTPRTAKSIGVIGALTGLACCFYILTGMDEQAGRLAATGTFGNSDDVALLAGYAIPFVVLLSLRFGNPLLRYSIMFAGCGFLMITVGRTATRTALLAFPAMVAVYFLRGKGMQRAGIVAAAAVASLAMLVVLPSSALTRLATIVDAFNIDSISQYEIGDDEALASVAGRRELTRDALRMIWANPLFGVGAGQFQDYRFAVLKRSYINSHNTIAQIAAESGIPAVLFYVAFLFSLFRTLLRIRKLLARANHPDSALLGNIATCLEAALAYFVVCALFMTCDRHPHQFVIAGLAIATENLLVQWIAKNPPGTPTGLRTTQTLPTLNLPAFNPARPAIANRMG